MLPEVTHTAVWVTGRPRKTSNAPSCSQEAGRRLRTSNSWATVATCAPSCVKT